MRGQMRIFGTTVACVALSAFAFAQSLFDGFETYNQGVLAGQGGWYKPVPASSLDWFVYNYGSNPLGIAPNPNGQNQMIAARKEGTLFPRTERNFNWSDRETWLISYDVYVGFDGTVGDGYNYDNIGSFSLQPSGSAQHFIDLFQWVTPTTDLQLGNPNDGWRATWVVGRLDDPGAPPFSRGWTVFYQPPNPFHGLQINKWYRRFVAFTFNGTDFRGEPASFLVKVGIRDLDTGQTNVAIVQPTQDFQLWYLIRPGGSSDLPTALRYFVGGGTGANNGNILAVDNLQITGFSYGDVNMDGCVDDADLLAVLFAFGNTGSFLAEDTNGDGTVDDADLLTVLFAFGEGC
jgi:hypothetical protein